MLPQGQKLLMPHSLHQPAASVNFPCPQAAKHPLLGSLMLCLATLLRDYKSEVEDILVSDKQVSNHTATEARYTAPDGWRNGASPHRTLVYVVCCQGVQRHRSVRQRLADPCYSHCRCCSAARARDLA